MKPPVLAYAAPTSVAEACVLLAADEDAKVLAGGQSLLPLLALRLAAPTTLVDIGRVPGLRGIEAEGDHLRIGALTTHADIETSELVASKAPMLSQAAGLIAHPQIRARGTMVGAVAHADPAAEWPAVLLALGGSVEVAGPAGTRVVPADGFFVGPFMTVLEPDDIITAIRVPLAPRGWWFGEHARRAGDYGLSIAALSCDLSTGVMRDVRIVVAGATGTVSRATAAEELLDGTEPGAATDRAVAAATQELTFSADIHGSAGYRRTLTTNLLRRGLRELAERTG